MELVGPVKVSRTQRLRAGLSNRVIGGRWGEVCAAARTTGMTEIRNYSGNNNSEDKGSGLGVKQLSFGLDERN